MHNTIRRFWSCYWKLQKETRDLADEAFELLKENPNHPSLHFKKVGKLWSARVDIRHRALAVKDETDFVWVWIGTHDEYEKMIKKR